MKKDSFNCLISNNEFPQFVSVEEHYYVHVNDGSSVEVSSVVCAALCRGFNHDCTTSFKLMCDDFGHLLYLVTYFFSFDDLTKSTVEFYIRDHEQK